MVAESIDADPKRISWTLSLKNRLVSGRRLEYSVKAVTDAQYRPFFRQKVYFDRGLNHITGQNPRFFPTSGHDNVGIYQVGMGSRVPERSADGAVTWANVGT